MNPRKLIRPAVTLGVLGVLGFAGYVTREKWVPIVFPASAVKTDAAEAARLGIGEGRLLHVAQSLYHDHVPAKAAGLPTVWIDRRHAKPGWGATPEPEKPVTPDWTFPSMAAFADAVEADAG